MLKTVAKLILSTKGWTIPKPPPPEIKRCVLLACPHTSNWDYLYAISFGFLLNIRFRVAIKHFWTIFPFGLIIKPLGGIGIKRGKDRDKSVSQIDLMAELFKDHDDLTLVIAPEGTRKLRKEWKTGYYHLAHEAKVPILPVFLDYKKRELKFSSIIDASREKSVVIGEVMNYYKNEEGEPLFSEKFTLDQRYL